VFRPRTFTDRTRLQEAVTAILRKYLDTFYRELTSAGTAKT